MKPTFASALATFFIATAIWHGGGTTAGGEPITTAMEHRGTEAQPDRDNTAVNVRDRGGATVTAQDQSESVPDRELTQKIRRAILADDSLSTNAKNVKVITIDGVVTLRGPVANEQERNAIVAKVNAIGVKELDNRLEEVSAR